MAKRRRWRSRPFVRVLMAACICLILLAGLGFGTLFFLLQGQAGKTSAVAERIRGELQSVVGDAFEVALGDTHLDLSDLGRIQLRSDNISITKRETNESLAEIGRLKVGVKILDIVSGTGNFEKITIENAELDAGVLGSGEAVLLPPHLDHPLDATGAILSRLNESFSSEGFNSFEISSSRISGPVMGRRGQDPIAIPMIRVNPVEGEGFEAKGLLETNVSRIDFESRYKSADADTGTPVYEFNAAGVSLLEWFHDPQELEGFVASDSNVYVGGTIGFDQNNQALDPNIKIVSSPGNLRIGRKAVTDIKAFELNFRLLLDQNQIELDPSKVEIGGLKATLIGGLKPEDNVAGYHGPIRYDMIMKHGINAVETEGEEAIPGAMKFAGVYDRAQKTATLERIVMTTERGFIEGSGTLGLTDPSPSLKATAKTDGISVAALKQFWPIFLSPGARKWVHGHVLDGWVTSGTLTADIPAGKLFNLNKGAKLEKDEYDVVFDLENFSFRPFGELPPIKKGKGVVSLQGMSVTGKLNEGEVEIQDTGTIQVESGSFAMVDFAASDRWGEVELAVTGDLHTIAAISDRKPLRVMERMKVAAKDFSGQGHADIAARFPVRDKVDYSEVNWNVLLDMVGGKSSRKLAGRRLSGADLLIDASPTGAQVTGTMNIDGVKSRVNMIEPIGKSGKVKRKRTVTMTLDGKQRETLGIKLEPVVEGPVGVTINQEGSVERYELNFKNAVLNLPWVGWSKGAGIPASGKFILKRLKNGVRLEKFGISGDGFSGAGTLEIDKQGLASADLPAISLNDGDEMSLKVKRSKNAYNINASGLSFDARGVLNTLIYQGNFGSAQGGRSVNLVADIQKVRGFGNRVIRNVVLLYDSANGQLKKLDVRGDGSEGRVYSIQAQLNGNDTLFTLNTNDAGTALAFSDIYTRMEGGEMQANLLQVGGGSFIGPVRITNFAVVDEPRLARIASSARKQIQTEDGQWERTLEGDGEKKARFQLADAQIERGKGFFNIQEGIIRSNGIGLTIEGAVYDPDDRMNLTGTFMPANGINLAVSLIPILRQLFSDGKKKALIGITYKLQGPRGNPEMLINPLSVVAPGVFNKVFEFKP